MDDQLLFEHALYILMSIFRHVHIADVLLSFLLVIAISGAIYHHARRRSS